MELIRWILGAAVALIVLIAMCLFVGVFVARTWGGEAVGVMRVRKRYMLGTHERLPVTVRRSVRGEAAFRDVYLLVGSAWTQSALRLSQVTAVRCAELLERALDPGAPAGDIGGWEIHAVNDPDDGRGVEFVIVRDSINGTDIRLHAIFSPAQARQLAQWLRIGAAPGRTLAAARLNLDKRAG